MTRRADSGDGINITRLALVVIYAVCVLGCHRSYSKSFSSNEGRERANYTLRSGKQIANVRVGCRLAPPSGPLTVYIDYDAPMPQRDYLTAASDAVDVWADFRTLAEARGAKALMVRSHDIERQREPVDFAFHVDSNGDWQRPEVRTLSTGTRLLILRAEMKDAGHFFIDYVTGIPIQDVCALGPEVDAVWASFRQVGEELGATKGLVSPSETPVGGATITFVFSRVGERWSRSDLCRK
jgi:hypothetical protein